VKLYREETDRTLIESPSLIENQTLTETKMLRVKLHKVGTNRTLIESPFLIENQTLTETRLLREKLHRERTDRTLTKNQTSLDVAVGEVKTKAEGKIPLP